MTLSTPVTGAGYALGVPDDKDLNGGFEFTRRKKWPQLLLKELIGTALFCLKPVNTSQSTRGPYSFKIVYATSSLDVMLGHKADSLPGRDFLDLVYHPDHQQILSFLTSLLKPTPPSLPHYPSSSSTATSSSTTLTGSSTIMGKSETMHVRMLCADSKGANERAVIWELRAHASYSEPQGSGSFTFGGPGAIIPPGQGKDGDGLKGRGVWVMGRRVGEVVSDHDTANSQSLDAFLELKLENERLRAELRELQADMDDSEQSSIHPTLASSRGSFADLSPVKAAYHPDLTDSESDSSASSQHDDSSPEMKRMKREKKLKRASIVTAPARLGDTAGEGLHVCVTCGRTDSPEWRKGPLGPKTLCNACGLRWAKRNSGAPARRDRKEKKV
ncbi:hypothetical protein M231_06673 [Tremella mesenterica]|uniref:GATA-type domain-containing protein n=1 Tax=Tremella mesenterica TaxID=5217 RepID=A0A4Q1BBE9_TREME|nr:hypothetical protein M231_06673 [Tremella mesenterica]